MPTPRDENTQTGSAPTHSLAQSLTHALQDALGLAACAFLFLASLGLPSLG